MKNKRKIGKKYEDLAVELLSLDGYILKDRNVFLRGAEIDIVMTKNNVLYLIEVRYRSGNRMGTAKESITPLKRKRMQLAAIEYINMIKWKSKYKISLCSFVGQDMDFLESIFL